MECFKKILVPVDFSDGSRIALDRALALAKCCDARIEVMHAWELPEFSSFGKVALAVRDEEGRHLEEVMPAEAERAMEAFLKPYRKRGKPPIAHRIVEGNAAKAIVKLAKHEGFDLIVMGTEGVAHIPGFLIGSVTEKVIRGAPCAVLAVPTDKE